MRDRTDGSDIAGSPMEDFHGERPSHTMCLELDAYKFFQSNAQVGRVVITVP